jgi:outer membrane protein OmpA-like peptidoglycan-associated protein
MSKRQSTVFWALVWTGSLAVASRAAFADEPPRQTAHEPVGFVTGGAIGGLAAGPFGAVIGAGIGTWLGNRVHRAGDATRAEAEVAQMMSEKNELLARNEKLSTQLNTLTQAVEQARIKNPDPASVLDGISGDVPFRTGSHDISPEIAQQIESLAKTLAKSKGLKIRLDGYADPRGTVDGNLQLSEARAEAVKQILLQAGIGQEAVELNAFGDSKATAPEGDLDGYALERRVTITLQAEPLQAATEQAETQPAVADSNSRP